MTKTALSVYMKCCRGGGDEGLYGVTVGPKGGRGSRCTGSGGVYGAGGLGVKGVLR